MSFAELHHFDGKKSREILIDMSAGCFRPLWTDISCIGFLVEYIDLNSKESTVQQMIEGYRRSAGTAPYCWPIEDWYIDDHGALVSRKYGEAFLPLSRTITDLPDGACVVFFEAAMVAVLEEGEISMVGRFD